MRKVTIEIKLKDIILLRTKELNLDVLSLLVFKYMINGNAALAEINLGIKGPGPFVNRLGLTDWHPDSGPNSRITDLIVTDKGREFYLKHALKIHYAVVGWALSVELKRMIPTENVELLVAIYEGRQINDWLQKGSELKKSAVGVNNFNFTEDDSYTFKEEVKVAMAKVENDVADGKWPIKSLRYNRDDSDNRTRFINGVLEDLKRT